MRLAAQLRRFRGGPFQDPGVDRLVQPGTPPSGAGLPQPGRFPAETTTTRGLIAGEHYRDGKRGPPGYLLVDRGLVQPEAASFLPGIRQPGTVRTAATESHG